MGLEKMKLEHHDSASNELHLIKAIAAKKGTAIVTEPYIYGGYLEAWYRCLQLSKQYTQNCRTGIFPNKAAFETYCLFGVLEDCPISQWWHEKGCEKFVCGMTSLQIRMVVKRQQGGRFCITLDAFEETSESLAGEEFSLIIKLIRILNSTDGLLSSAPLAWPMYKCKISCDSIKLCLDVYEAHERLIKNSDKGNLWRIGEQLRLNPKAMPKPGDAHGELVDKHIAMGKTVSAMVKKGRGLIENASNGLFPLFKLPS